MTPHQEECSVHPEWAAAVREQDFQLGEIYRDVVDVDRIAVFVAGSREDGRSGVEHDWNSIAFGGTINDLQFSHSVQVLVGIEKLVRRMDLDHPELEPQQLRDIGVYIRCMARVQASAGEQRLGIFFDVIGDELIYAVGKS